MNRISFVFAFVLGISVMVLAQDDPSVIYYQGQGRTEIGVSNFDETSNFIEDDTTSERRDLSGQFLFDLGINIEPNKLLRVNSILRITNEFGGFYSQGSALSFRQVRIYGVVGNKLAYQIGDVDLQMTPYTLYNNYDMFNSFESSIFSQRRDIMKYENFNTENQWRLQGAQTNFSVIPQKLLSEIKFDAFGTRIRQTDYLTTPDRLLTGGTISLLKDQSFYLKGHGISLFDVVGTSPDTLANVQNTIFSGEVMYTQTLGGKDFYALVEGGRSLLKGDDLTQDIHPSATGTYFDGKLGYKSVDKSTQLSVGYRRVSDRFNSAGAQSRRVYADKTPSLFAAGLNGVSRQQNIYDRMIDSKLYSQSISTRLMAYNPIFGNATPYGKATPNRSGINLHFNTGNKDSLLYVLMEADLLSEIEGEGVSEKRKFVMLQGGVNINISKAVGFEKLLALTLGSKYEKTTRSGNANIDLSSVCFDAGIEWEFLKSLDLLAGYKMVNGKGNEFDNVYDGFNNIIQYESETLYDQTQSVAAIALRYRFSDYNFITFSGNFVSLNDRQNQELNYKYDQVYVNYTLKF